jgi:hypothetical protein
MSSFLSNAIQINFTFHSHNRPTCQLILTQILSKSRPEKLPSKNRKHHDYTHQFYYGRHPNSSLVVIINEKVTNFTFIAQ